MSAPVRVLIVDDDDLMRAGLRAVLSSDATIEVAGEAGDGAEAPAAARRLRPDVVLMDVRMPGVDGIAATRQVLDAAPETRVVILTTFEEDDYIFGALGAGASGFLLKRTRPEDLIAAVHTIAAGDSLLAPSVTRRVIERMATRPSPAPAEERLDVAYAARARRAGAGRPRPQQRGDRRRAVIEESTVKTHVKRILGKLGARDRVQAVIAAFEGGWPGLDPRVGSACSAPCDSPCCRPSSAWWRPRRRAPTSCTSRAVEEHRLRRRILLRVAIASSSAVAAGPAEAGDCDLDWIGTEIALGRGRVSVGSCRGDIGPLCVEQTGDCPALAYGTSLTLPSKVRCTSRRAGLTCRARNGAGVGFAVSRSGYRIFR